MANNTELSKANEKIYEQIMTQLEAGVVPWRKPWTASRPRNGVYNTPYRGINVFILSSSGYNDERWYTFNQLKNLGGSVKGQKSTPVVLWMPKTIKEDDKQKRILIFKMYHVFNFEQITGLKVTESDEQKLKEARAKELLEAEDIIKLYTDAPSVQFGGDRAFYSPKLDIVKMPTKVQFHSTEEYYCTLFHEFAHSTGHENRLKRKGVAEFDAFGTEQYSEEELIAEFTSAFLCAKAQIDNTVQNSSAYIKGWMKAFKDNPKMIMSCASKAQTACDYICGKRYNNEAETPAEALAEA